MTTPTTVCSFSDLYFYALYIAVCERESKGLSVGRVKVMPVKQSNYLKAYLPWQSEFDHHFACWANNHRGWAKMKKSNKRLAKRREKRALRKEIDAYGYDNG